MPWIHATLSSSAVPTGRLAHELVQAVANAIAGAVRRVVATATGLSADLVAVVRS